MDDRDSLFNGHTARASWARDTIPTGRSSAIQCDCHGTCLRYDLLPGQKMSMLSLSSVARPVSKVTLGPRAQKGHGPQGYSVHGQLPSTELGSVKNDTTNVK